MDTMVWSSAQPQNVQKMVSTAFGKHESRLLDVWARDKMGLTPMQYSKKVQTTKDLRKIWSKHKAHSAKSTLLLDDSPAKAFYQPNNHICLLEYIRTPPPPASTSPAEDLAAQIGALSLDKPDASLDKTLLAIIGILTKLKDEQDVQQWIANNGLFRDRPQTGESAKAEESFWFTDSDIFAAWIGAGEEALQQLDITLNV